MSIPIPDWAKRVSIEIEKTQTSYDWAQIIANHWHCNTQILHCAFCNQAYPPGTPDSQYELLSAHIRVCSKHPMRKVEAERDALRAQIHDLCHDMHVPESVTPAEFCNGCENFQIKLFGESPITTIRKERDIARHALTILRTSPSILPMMSGLHLSRRQLIALLDSARDGKEWVYEPNLEEKTVSYEREEWRNHQEQLSYSLRSLISILEVIDSDERHFARAERRMPNLHTEAISEARAALEEHGKND